jgi:mannitol/fructose-specific phosphotransferase system IIA component (Ntr-type)
VNLDDLTVVNLQAKSRWDAKDELLTHLMAANTIKRHDLEAITNAIKQREAETSTGIGFGIALPHASTDLVSEPVAIIGRSKDGIPFDAIDGQPVHRVVLFLVPQGQMEKHKHMLANIAKMLHRARFREEP